jgi:serine/threonine protein phosphatase PrpC
MEDAHACVLDLQRDGVVPDSTSATPNRKLSFFGVYDGHGGDKVAIYAGEHLHKIVANQDSYGAGDIEQALKDGFLATDRAILTGNGAPESWYEIHLRSTDLQQTLAIMTKSLDVRHLLA